LAGLVGVLVGTFFLSSLEFKFFWMALLLISLNRNLEQEEIQVEQGSAAFRPHWMRSRPCGPADA
jgi:hypothetical protein